MECYSEVLLDNGKGYRSDRTVQVLSGSRGRHDGPPWRTPLRLEVPIVKSSAESITNTIVFSERLTMKLVGVISRVATMKGHTIGFGS